MNKLSKFENHYKVKAIGFTMAERRSSASEQRVECQRHATRFLRVEQDSRFLTLGNSLAFTMAEILISLTIIGVIAAITLPSLRANINEKTWATQRKALYSRMSQAISMLPSLNGYGIVMNTDGTINETETASKAAQAFITAGIGKVLKISNICDSANLNKCGLSAKYTKFDDTKVDFPKNMQEYNPSYTTNYYNPHIHINTAIAAFEMVNGESVAVLYNPYCTTRDVKYELGTAGSWEDREATFPRLCALFLFDLNGLKGPNKMGKDMWVITSLYSVEPSVIMFEPNRLTKYKNGVNFNSAKQYCASQNARMANLDEGIAAYLSAQGFSMGWLSNETGKTNLAYYIITGGLLIKYGKAETGGVGVRCIKR